jgi:hypothetical protein
MGRRLVARGSHPVVQTLPERQGPVTPVIEDKFTDGCQSLTETDAVTARKIRASEAAWRSGHRRPFCAKRCTSEYAVFRLCTKPFRRLHRMPDNAMLVRVASNKGKPGATSSTDLSGSPIAANPVRHTKAKRVFGADTSWQRA